VISRPSVAGPSRRQWILLICLFLFSLPAVTPRLYSSDEIQYFAYLRSLWFDHDLSFENEYQHFYDLGIARSDGFHQTFLELKTDTGRRINFGTIGCAILWSPFYAVGDLVARVTGAPADGYSKPYVAAVAYASASYGFLSLVLALACSRHLGLNGFPAVLAIWLGTPLLFYMYVAPPFSHATSAFSVALFIYTWLRVRRTWSLGGAAALGAAGALMAMVREQDVFFTVPVAVDVALWMASASGDLSLKLRRVLAGCVAFAIVFLPQAAAYLVVNGHLGPHASVSHKMTWTAPHKIQVLFSPEHGYFVWTPLALVALAGLFVPPFGAGRRSDDGLTSGGGQPIQATVIGLVLLAMVLLQVYVGGSVESWTVAGGFGQRRFVALTTVLVVAYAGLHHWMRARPARALLTAVTLVAVYWNLALTAEFAIGLMDRQKLEPRKNAYDAFVTLPTMAPDLIYRYLFDRASFYQRHER